MSWSVEGVRTKNIDAAKDNFLQGVRQHQSYYMPPTRNPLRFYQICKHCLRVLIPRRRSITIFLLHRHRCYDSPGEKGKQKWLLDMRLEEPCCLRLFGSDSSSEELNAFMWSFLSSCVNQHTPHLTSQLGQITESRLSTPSHVSFTFTSTARMTQSCRKNQCARSAWKTISQKLQKKAYIVNVDFLLKTLGIDWNSLW